MTRIRHGSPLLVALMALSCCTIVWGDDELTRRESDRGSYFSDEFRDDDPFPGQSFAAPIADSISVERDEVDSDEKSAATGTLNRGFGGLGMSGAGMNGPGMRGPGMGGPGMGGPGMGGPGMGGPGMGGPGYGVTWYPSADTSSLGSKLSVFRQRLNVGAPVWGDGTEMVMLSIGVQGSTFSTSAMLPDSGQFFPEELYNVSLGTNYMHRFENGWTAMAGINFGSASDVPFHSIHEMNIGFMSFLQVPARNERDMWMFMLMYSPVGNFTFPLPGLSYQWNPSETFHASVGVPFSVTWLPYENLTVSVMYMPIVNVNFRTSYRLTETVSLYGGFESLQEAYFLAAREQLADRFMGFEKRIFGGMQYSLWKHGALDFCGGYAFDRYYGVGQNQIGGSSLRDRIDIGSGAFVMTNLQVRF